MGARKPFSNGISRTAGLRDRPQQIGAVKGGHGGEHEYVILRQAEADHRNAQLATAVRKLETILSVGLERDARLSLDAVPEPTPADLPAELRPPAPPDRQAFTPPPAGLLARWLPGASAKQAQAVESGQVRFQAALAQWGQARVRQSAELARLKADARAQNEHIAEQRSALKAGEPQAVSWYAQQVLLHSPYPDHFPKDLEVGFLPDSRELVVDLRAPAMEEIVPTVDSYRFDKARNKILALARAQRARADLYILVVSQMALRTLHEVFDTDIDGNIAAVKLQLYAVTIDPSTGKTVRPSLITARVTRAQFDGVDLTRVEPVACLRRLSGGDAGERPAWAPSNGSTR